MRRCLTCGKEKSESLFFHTEVFDSEKGITKPVYRGLHCIECHDAGSVEFGWGWKDFPKRPPWALSTVEEKKNDRI